MRSRSSDRHIAGKKPRGIQPVDASDCETTLSRATPTSQISSRTIVPPQPNTVPYQSGIAAPNAPQESSVDQPSSHKSRAINPLRAFPTPIIPHPCVAPQSRHNLIPKQRQIPVTSPGQDQEKSDHCGNTKQHETLSPIFPHQQYKIQPERWNQNRSRQSSSPITHRIHPDSHKRNHSRNPKQPKQPACNYFFQPGETTELVPVFLASYQFEQLSGSPFRETASL